MKKLQKLETRISRQEMTRITGGGAQSYARPACLPGGICPAGQCCRGGACWTCVIDI